MYYLVLDHSERTKHRTMIKAFIVDEMSLFKGTRFLVIFA